MVERRELITICRQIGTMMEVGVDFLRLTRALREQTDNPRLLELYDQIEHDMRMGENLADAISKAPDVFSPFAVSLIRQGEARGDVEGAWHRLADSLKQEAQEDKDLGLDGASHETDSTKNQAPRVSVSPRRLPLSANNQEPFWIESIRTGARRLLLSSATYLVALGVLWWGAQNGSVRWQMMVPLQLFMAALWLLVVALWPANRPLKMRQTETETEASLPIPKHLEAATSRGTVGLETLDSGGEVEKTLEEKARQESARTEELLRNFAPTFAVVEAPPEDDSELDDPSTPSTPNSEKRFQL